MDVVRGTLELLVLKTLSRGEAMHGFAVLQWIRDATGGELVVEEGALYPALHRLERKGCVKGVWQVSEKGRRAKYYGLTALGRKQLVREETEWLRYLRAWESIALAAAAT